MGRSLCAAAVLMLFFWTTVSAQDLKVGVGGGALFLQGPRGFGPEMHGRGGGFSSSYSLGGEVEYSLPSLPLSLVGEVSYAPMSGPRRRDSTQASLGRDAHRRDEASFFSAGIGGRWTPLRGPVSPYLGLTFLVSHTNGSRVDSSRSFVAPYGGGPNEGREFPPRGGITRFGVGFGVGSEFALFSLVDLDVGASYTLNNLFGGRRGGSLNTIAFGASVLLKVL